VSTETNEDGHFVFPELPYAARYEVLALSTAGSARVSVGVEELDEPVRLTLAPLLYERFRFFDGEGSPISMEGRNALGRFPATSYRWSSQIGLSSSLEELGAMHDVVLRPNEVAFVGLPPTAHQHTHEIKIEGFDAVELPVAPRLMSEWPASTDVVLRRRNDERPTTAFRIDFPQVSWPEPWTDDNGHERRVVISVNARVGKHVYTFYPRPEQRFRCHEVASVGFRSWELPFEIVHDAEGPTVRPKYPVMSYLEIRYPPHHEGEPDRSTLPLLYPTAPDGSLSPPGALWPTLVAPNSARFGPIPVGLYTIELTWPADSTDDVVPAWRTPTPVSLGEGLQRYESRVDR